MQSPMKLEISLYPFFSGNSFLTSYEYTDLAVGRSFLNSENEFTISLNIKNVGSHSGMEVARLSIQTVSNHSHFDAKRLRRFEKVLLKPGESKNIKFFFNPSDVLNTMLGNRELEVTAGELKRKFSFQA
jgi:beta-glucosidase